MPNQIGIRSLATGAALGVAVAAAGWIGIPYYESGHENQSVIALFHEIELGEDRDEAAMRLLSKLNGQAVFGSAERWYVSSPPRFLQDHWVLVICLRSGAVEGKRIGIADELNKRPAAAPPVQGICRA